MLGVGRLALTFCFLFVAAVSARGQEEKPLTLEEARQFMLVLINRDREAKGLKPVKLDPVASEAGRKHAEEMAVYQFMAHHNQEGKLPDQRYTEAGGIHYVRENVYLKQRYGRTPP